MKSIKAITVTLALALLLAGCKPTYHTLGEGESASASAPASLQQAGATASPKPEQPASSAQEPVSLEEAQSLALAHAQVDRDQAVFTQTRQEQEDGRLVYEIEFSVAGEGRYEYEVDAGTGEILKASWEAEQEADPGREITADEAKALALAKVPGAALSDIWEFEEDRDHGQVKYEGEIFYGGTKYEFEIDGATGAFLSWEKEGAIQRD